MRRAQSDLASERDGDQLELELDQLPAITAPPHTIEDANNILEIFMYEFNKRFAKPPLSSHNVHRQLRATDDLDHVFGRK